MVIIRYDFYADFLFNFSIILRTMVAPGYSFVYNKGQYNRIIRRRFLMNDIKHVVWDWNGTLLDDIDVSMEALDRKSVV